jgi:hypothetical protein
MFIDRSQCATCVKCATQRLTRESGPLCGRVDDVGLLRYFVDTFGDRLKLVDATIFPIVHSRDWHT